MKFFIVTKSRVQDIKGKIAKLISMNVPSIGLVRMEVLAKIWKMTTSVYAKKVNNLKIFQKIYRAIVKNCLHKI